MTKYREFHHGEIDPINPEKSDKRINTFWRTKIKVITFTVQYIVKSVKYLYCWTGRKIIYLMKSK